MIKDRTPIQSLDSVSSPCTNQFDDAEFEEWESLLLGKEIPEKVVLHKYSPAIAKLLNPQQPDIAGAVLLHRISLRQKNRCPDIWIKGSSYAVRSLSKLAQDCPYLSRSAVARAIKRMKLKLKDKFIVRRNFVRSWYSISDDLLKLQKEDRLVSFRCEDALYHGNIRTAVVLHHMRCAIRESAGSIRDSNGMRYVHMSPSALSNALGYSEDTITRCLRSLCKNKILTRHPQHPQWYAFAATTEYLKCSGSDVARLSPTAIVHKLHAFENFARPIHNLITLIHL